MTVADRIKLLREKRGYTQEEMAKKMGYTNKSTISKIESSGDKVTLKRVAKCAEILNCTPSYLMGWTDEEQAVIDHMKDKIESLGSNEQGYYLDEETARIAQEVFENPDTRMLFDAARGAKPEDIKMAAEMLRRFKETNHDV